MVVARTGRAAGFSLVELLVGMVLGMILMSGAASIYLSSKRSYVEVEQVAALSENARFAELLVTDSLRHAGNFGEVTPGRVELAADLSAVAGDCTGAAAAYDTANFLSAATAVGPPDGPGSAFGCITDAIPGTDVLVVKHVVPRPYSDGPREGGDPNDPLQNDGTIDTPTALQPDRTYVMTNNIGGIVFDGADTPPTITTGGDLPGGVAWEYQFETFYIRQACADCIPQLSRKVLAWNSGAMEVVTEDVVEGVEDLRLLFGFDADNDGEVDTYSNVAGVAGNWGRVESVEMFMLVRSATADPQYTDIKTYHLGGGVTVQPDDDVLNFRRLVTHASVSLRNMKLIIRGGA